MKNQKPKIIQENLPDGTIKVSYERDYSGLEGASGCAPVLSLLFGVFFIFGAFYEGEMSMLIVSALLIAFGVSSFKKWDNKTKNNFMIIKPGESVKTQFGADIQLRDIKKYGLREFGTRTGGIHSGRLMVLTIDGDEQFVTPLLKAEVAEEVLKIFESNMG